MQKNVNMLDGPILKNIVVYTIPIILTGILQLLFNAADLVIVGRFCGSNSVAAVGATSSIIHLLVNLFMGLSAGAGVTAANFLGAKNEQGVFKTVHTALPLAFICGFILTIIGIFCSKPLLMLMGTPNDVLNLSSLYMQIYFCGTIPNMIYNFGAAILRAAGDTKGPLIYLSLSGVINVILNIIFVTLMDLDVAGVALATAISQTISGALVLISLVKRTDSCRFIFSKMHFYKNQLMRIIKIGVPAGIQSSLFSISNVLIQSSVNSFGTTAVSGSAAAANIEGFVYVTMNSFHQTALNFIGQNNGAGNYRRIKKITGASLLSVSFAGILLGVLVYIFAKPLLSIYITDSPLAIEYGITRIALISLPYFVCGLMDVMTGALRGLGVSISPMIITVLGVCGFRVLWIYTVFAYFHTYGWLYLSYIISWTITFFIELILFLVIINKRIKNFPTAL